MTDSIPYDRKDSMASALREALEDRHPLFPSRLGFAPLLEMAVSVDVPEPDAAHDATHAQVLAAQKQRIDQILAMDAKPRTPEELALDLHADKITVLTFRIDELEKIVARQADAIEQLRAAQAMQGRVLAKQGGCAE